MRTKLTNNEWNAVSRLTRLTMMDDWFDIQYAEEDTDYDSFYDFEEGAELSLEEGFEIIYEAQDGILTTIGLTDEEVKLIKDLVLEFTGEIIS